MHHEQNTTKIMDTSPNFACNPLHGSQPHKKNSTFVTFNMSSFSSPNSSTSLSPPLSLTLVVGSSCQFLMRTRKSKFFESNWHYEGLWESLLKTNLCLNLTTRFALKCFSWINNYQKLSFMLWPPKKKVF